MRSFKKISLILSLLITFTIGTNHSLADKDENNDKKEAYKMLQIFNQALTHIKNRYVEEKSYKDLIDSAIKGMLTSLDPHSTFLTKKDFKRFKESISGEFAGVGMTVQKDKKTNFILVVAPIDGTPAQKSGMKSGDIVIKVDDVFLDTISFESGIKMLRGKPNTNVVLEVLRDNGEPFKVTITRSIIKVPSVKAEIKDNNIAYIKLIQFQENLTKKLRKEVKRLNKESNNKIRGFIIDLRNNPGGLLTEAIGVSDAFLDQGEIVSTRGRNKDKARRSNATKGDITNGKPIVVLVNRGSASASEIVAGALQDHKRAIIVGERTFGKGSVQSIIKLADKMAVKFTTARYYTPNGRSIQKLGVIPDIKIVNVKIEKEFNRGNYGENLLNGAISNNQINKSKKYDKKMSTKDKLKAKKDYNDKKKSLNITDYPLARALDILNTMILVNENRKQLF